MNALYLSVHGYMCAGSHEATLIKFIASYEMSQFVSAWSGVLWVVKQQADWYGQSEGKGYKMVAILDY